MSAQSGYDASQRLCALAEATGVIVSRNDVRSISFDVSADPMIVTIELYPTEAFLAALAQVPIPVRESDADPEGGDT